MVVSTNACPSCSLMASRCAPRWSRLVASECLLFRYRNRRHSLATAMLKHGASLGEIGQLLRHAHPDTTQNLCEGRCLRLTSVGTALAGRWAMTTLRQAAQDYIRMRRHLGFKMRHEERRLRPSVPISVRQVDPQQLL